MSTTNFHITPAVAEAASRVRLLLVPTSPDDASFTRARAAARQLVTEGDRESAPVVVLYDRSDERWTDTPHPEGPFGPDEIDTEHRPHLVDQMAEFTAAGLEVRAWYASVPALTAIISAVQGLDADAVLVPEELDRPRMMDRLQAGDDTGELIGRVLSQNLDQPIQLFMVADETNEITVSSTQPSTDRIEAAPSEASG